MLKIRALNRKSTSDEETPIVTREAEEEITLELYNKALRLQTQEVFSEAETILLKLLEENIPLLENNGGLPKSMSNLKYSCHINIGNIYLKLNRVNDALERFLLASELDATDVTLWYKIGNLSIDEHKFQQSAYAFIKGLECSESHWPCLDKLISVLYAIRDTIACLEYIGKALILDPDYTKGLVLRKQIYRDNPASKEYYKLYNPDCVCEPPLDVPIDEDDEKTYLEEVQTLINKVTEAEKALEPKPLQTIALPKPLNDYTWLSLTETIVYIHQYISDQEMSHFTQFDMSKSMSYTEESKFKLPQSEENSKVPEDKGNEGSKLTSANIEVHDDKSKSESIIERRMSQNSDNVAGNQETTPVQTDNDEEHMEQDNEDQDENLEPKEKGKPRGSKRKRDLLSDLQTWGWYSRRKLSKKAKEKDFTVEDAFERIIPKHLLPHRIDPEKFNNFEESMNTMDLYNMYMENCKVNTVLSPIHSPKSVNYEQYFGTERERDDVEEFWTKQRDYIDAVVLIKELIFCLSKLWHYKWPQEMISLYIKAYNMFREHYDPPQVFGAGHSFEDLRNDALASVLFCELSTFSCDSKESVPVTLMGYMRLISGWDDKWKDEYPSFFIRVYWLQTHLFRKENNNELAINSLQLVREAIEEEEVKQKEKYMLNLPNCFKYNLINLEIINKILKHLDVINSLGAVESLYNSEKYREAADIITATFNGGPCPQVGRMGRPAQLGILMHSLWYLDKAECFVWTEECLNEAFEQYLKFNKDQDKWEKILEKCLAILYEIIKMDTICVIDYLPEKNRARIVGTLAKIISKQLNNDNVKNAIIFLKPWILLHFLLLRDEQREYAKKRISRGKEININNETDDTLDNTLPSSIDILFSAHEFLGTKGCCMLNQGEFLHFIIDTVLDKLDTPIFEHIKDKISIHIEQAMFCLYQHPSKKNKISRHLADHNVDPIPLSWERASQLFEFYGPESLPEFNSYKNASISTDLEQLFKRIIAQVPANVSPQQHLQKIIDYIHGKTEIIMNPIDFPRKVRSIYYLIGDFYFKQREFGKCIKYFQIDLCINPYRLDSWACLGLSYAAQLDTKLNHCEKFKTEMEFLEKAKYATICFKKALEICPDPLMLWIEYGTFQYTAHSYCSRILKFESENLSMEKFEFLENQKNSYLDSSGNSFEKAISIYEEEDTNEADERWLQYYILGKIAEKRQKEPTEYLQYYLTASTLLEENNAEYPEKINYNNPQHLSVEALELHYRIHASVLKYLELHEGKDIPSSLGSFFKKCLSDSKYLKKTSTPTPAPTTTVEPAVTNFPNTANTSSNYQEQFLNSLNATNVDEKSKETSNKINETSLTTTQETPIKAPENNETSITSKINEAQTEISGNNTKKVSEKNDCNVDSIIILSDSDDDTKMVESDNKSTLIQKTEEYMDVDENVSNGQNHSNKMEINNTGSIDLNTQKDKPTENTDLGASIEKKLEGDAASIDNEVKDVQTVLDEMMMETMKETDEFRVEADSDLSGTEKIEEVSLKEDHESKGKNKKVSEIVPDTELHKSNDEELQKKKEESSSGSSSSSSSSESSDSESDDDDDSSSSSSSSSSSDENNEFMSHSEISHLIEKCIFGLETCIVRLTQNYKALYRLAHVYFNYKSKKDLAKCKQLLLSEYKCKDGTMISGLFSDRKPNNFFNGIWRIPSTEIDRPGSLSAHMNRCLSLLMQILRTTNDTKTLIDICVHLRKTPEPDKIYIKDSERLAFSEQALTMCIQSIRAQLKNITNMSNPQIAKLLQEICKIYQRLQKHVQGKETPFANLLEEVYRKFIKEKIPENVNVLDLALKFCSQNRAAEKQKLQGMVKPQSLTPRSAVISTATPVMPSPQTINPSTPTVLKRPGTARPRGRPPLQKVPGQPRYQRPKSPSTTGLPKQYPWQKSLMDHSYAYEYLKHYQDELIKQYSQNLSIAQLTQLSSILTQGQINNPLTATAITSQMLAQTGLLNSDLLKQINSTGSMAPNASQLMDSLNQLNPNMKKKLGVDQALSNLTSDQLKVLGNLIPKQGTSLQNRPNIPYTSTSASGINSKQGKSSSSQRQSTSKSIITDHTKNKPSNSSNTITSSTISLTGTQIFKEPATKHSVQEEKAAKDLMKDRPNLSITPVGVTASPPPSVSPNFLKPTSTSSSCGKTLQEKLAEKKKEQLSKQMKSSNDEEKRQTDAFMKSLNFPSIPASLTVSPAQPSPSLALETPSSLFCYPKTTSSSKFPIDTGIQPSSSLKTTLPGSLTLSKSVSSSTAAHSYGTINSLPTNTFSAAQVASAYSTAKPGPSSQATNIFPVDSGMSISQVPVKNQKKKEKSLSKKYSPPALSIERKLSNEVKKYAKKNNKVLLSRKMSQMNFSEISISTKGSKESNQSLIKQNPASIDNSTPSIIKQIKFYNKPTQDFDTNKKLKALTKSEISIVKTKSLQPKTKSIQSEITVETEKSFGNNQKCNSNSNDSGLATKLQQIQTSIKPQSDSSDDEVICID